MAVQASILKHPGSGMQPGQVQKPMSRTWNGHEYKRWRVSLDTSFLHATERKYGLSHLYRYLVFQGSTVSCKHVETIWLSCRTWECIVHIGTALHVLPRLSLLKLTLHSSLFQVQDCHHFLKTSTFDCSGNILLFILQSENTADNNTKGWSAVLSVKPYVFPNTVLPSLGFHGLTLSILVQHTVNTESSVKMKAKIHILFKSPFSHWQATLLNPTCYGCYKKKLQEYGSGQKYSTVD